MKILLLIVLTYLPMLNDNIDDQQSSTTISTWTICLNFYSPLINHFDETVFENGERKFRAEKNPCIFSQMRFDWGARNRSTRAEYVVDNALVKTNTVNGGPLRKVLKKPFLA